MTKATEFIIKKTLRQFAVFFSWALNTMKREENVPMDKMQEAERLLAKVKAQLEELE